MIRCALRALLATLMLLSARPLPAETAEEILQRARGCLAQLEGELKLPGLKQPVEVLRDRWGVAHLYAQNQQDLFFAQGVIAAQDRLFQIDLWRRRGVGELAEVLGPSALQGDRFARLVKYRGDMDAEWASYSPDAQAIVTSFTDGINAYIDHLGDRLPLEYQLLDMRPKKWRPEDCLGRMSGVIMARNFRYEVARAELLAAVGLPAARRLLPVDPQVPWKPAEGLDLAGVDRQILAGYEAATKALRIKPTAEGSNNWAIDGALSSSGSPLLASDPHRSIELPSLRYLVHLNAPGWDVIGGGEPGLPGVAIGHNEKIAWGFTIVGTDQADLYVEQTHPDDPTRYLVGDRWEPMQTVREQVRVKGMPEPVELELRFTRHGPVIHEDHARQRAYALRWVGSEPGTAAYLGSLAVDRAHDWDEYQQAMKAWKMPSENMVYADQAGNIGWVAAALTPIRQGWHGVLPVPGAAGDFEWQGFLPTAELPRDFNPARHFIATANHKILTDEYRHEIGYEFSPPFRFQQVERRLADGRKLDVAECCSIQHDNHSLPGAALVRLIKQVKMEDPKLEPYARLLAGWDGVLTRESQAGPLYAVWLARLQREFFRAHLPAAQLEIVQAQQTLPMVLQALENPTAAWFGSEPKQQRDRLARETFAAAVKQLSAELGNDPEQWSWGKLHHAHFEHPLGALSPAHAQALDLGPVSQAGDAYSPNATRHDERFRQRNGASYRHVFDLADWDQAMATSTPGQSGQPGSPHYDDLLKLWQQNQYFPLVYTRKRVVQETRHRLMLIP